MALKYQAQEDANFKKLSALALRAAMEETLGMPLHMIVKSASVMHTELQPEGDMFTLTIQLEVHPKKVEEKKE